MLWLIAIWPLKFIFAEVLKTLRSKLQTKQEWFKFYFLFVYSDLITVKLSMMIAKISAKKIWKITIT